MQIKIFYTGDIHWNISSFSQVSSVVKNEKSPWLLFDAGDSISALHDGLESVLAMNLAGYHAVLLGNHELDIPPEKLCESLKKAEFPVLAPNLKISCTDLPIIYKIFEVSGKKIAVIGICYPGILSGQPVYDGYSFSSPEDVLRENLSKLKQQSDVMIVISHLGFDEDRRIASEFPEIDVIIGGHTHTVIENNFLVKNTFICHSGGEGNYLGELTVDFDGQKVFSHHLISLDKILPDLEFRDKFGKLREAEGIPFDAEILGESKTDFLAEKYSGETALGDFVSDLIRFSLEADIVFLNATCVNPILRKGRITRELLKKVIYWDNELYLGTLPGSEIYKIFSDMLSSFLEDPYYFCYFSGITVEYIDDPMCRKVFQNREKLEKIMPMSVGIKQDCENFPSICDRCIKENSPVCLRKDEYGQCEKEKIRIYIDGNPLIRDNFYSIVTTGYLINGGLAKKYSGFFEKYPFNRCEQTLKDLILNYFRNQSELRWSMDYRLKVSKNSGK